MHQQDLVDHQLGAMEYDSVRRYSLPRIILYLGTVVDSSMIYHNVVIAHLGQVQTGSSVAAVVISRDRISCSMQVLTLAQNFGE
jgi:hypothetical protein